MATSRDNKSISQFKSALIGGGARPNLFEVELTTLPNDIAWNADNFRFMCKAAALPAQNIAQIDVPFRGRIFKVAGDRTIDTNAKVFQLGRGSTKASTNSDGSSNAVLKEYEFVDIFPTTISEIALSYDTGDTIEEFDVEFQVQSLNLTGAGSPNG